MDDKILLKEIFKRLGQNFYDNRRNVEVPETDSIVAAEALQETLYNMSFDEGIHYSMIESLDGNGCGECKFNILM